MSVFGLQNNGNTCYLNSAVQLLCLNKDFESIENIKNDPTNAIVAIKNRLCKINKSFMGSRQHDSGEAFILLLEYYSKQLNNIKDYEFNQITRIKCKLMKCLHEEIVNYKSNALMIDITSDDLYQCYVDSKDSEKLQGDNSWKCPKCKKPSPLASKRFIYNDWSKYLVIGLRRFVLTPHGYKKNKNPVKVPHNWNHGFKLVGSILHHGSMNGGHYVAVGKKNNKWYLFDDSRVKQITNEKELESYLNNSYFFLYKR